MRSDLVRDLDTIPMTRGQLVALLIRIYMAEEPRMSLAKAEMHARMQVDATFMHMKAGV